MDGGFTPHLAVEGTNILSTLEDMILKLMNIMIVIGIKIGINGRDAGKCPFHEKL